MKLGDFGHPKYSRKQVWQIPTSAYVVPGTKYDAVGLVNRQASFVRYRRTQLRRRREDRPDANTLHDARACPVAVLPLLISNTKFITAPAPCTCLRPSFPNLLSPVSRPHSTPHPVLSHHPTPSSPSASMPSHKHPTLQHQYLLYPSAVASAPSPLSLPTLALASLNHVTSLSVLVRRLLRAEWYSSGRRFYHFLQICAPIYIQLRQGEMTAFECVPNVSNSHKLKGTLSEYIEKQIMFVILTHGI